MFNNADTYRGVLFCHVVSNFLFFLMAALWNTEGHIFLPFGFFFFLSIHLLFSSPNLRRRRLDVCHRPTYTFTQWCGVSLRAILRCRSETCCTRLAENQVAISAAGKNGRFAQLQVQLGSGNASKKWSCTPLRSHKLFTIIWENMHSEAVVTFCHKFYGLW